MTHSHRPRHTDRESHDTMPYQVERKSPQERRSGDERCADGSETPPGGTRLGDPPRGKRPRREGIAASEVPPGANLVA